MGHMGAADSLLLIGGVVGVVGCRQVLAASEQ